MCFSAEASFGAATVITTIGVLSFKKAKGTDLRLLAMIPVFFGIQQFSEGILWLSSRYEQFAGMEKTSTYAFIFFAQIIWPLYLPFALWKLESNPRKKRALFSLTLTGVFVATALTYIIVFRGVHARIDGFSIVYEFNAPDYSWGWIFGGIYAASVVLPTIISSISKMWWLGAANIILYTFSKIYFTERVISVWCFFAALTSILMLWIIILEKKKGKPEQVKPVIDFYDFNYKQN